MNGFRVQNLLIIVSILGLVACTPDKPTTREDQWRFAPPEILMPGSADGVERGRMKVGEASQKELPLSASLTFPSMTSDIILEIDSLCSCEGINFEETFAIKAPQELSLGSIVPARALLEAADKSVECSFDFSAVNEHRSRHHFLIPGVKLVGGAEYGTLVVSQKLQRISPAEVSEARVTISVDELDQLAVDSKLQSGVAELVCADFTSREHFRSVDTINWKQLAYKQPIEVLENVLRKFRQPCRVALNDETGLRKEISAAFVIRYPPPAIEISASVSPLGRGDDSGRRDASILNLKIRNLSNIDQAFALTNATVPIRYVFSTSGRSENADNFFYSVGRHPTADISYRIDGVEKTFSVNGKTVFILKAKSEIQVSVIANAYYNYQAAQGTQHAGYLMLFPEPLRIERLEAIGDLETAIQGAKFEKADEVPIFNTLPHHFAETQVYLPHEQVNIDWSFVARTMREGRLPKTGD